jgi:hypothetical protein
MKEELRKAAEAVFPLARVVVDPFYVIVDSNKRMDEARRIEQDVHGCSTISLMFAILLVAIRGQIAHH